MRVALVCPYAWDRFGGVQTHVRALTEALKERGHDVAVLAPYTDEGSERIWEDVLPVGRAIKIPINGSVAPLAFGPVAAAGIRKALKEFDPEVVHLHEPLIPSLSLLALWNTEAPIVGTFHAAADSSFGYQATKPVLNRAAKRLDVRTTVSEAARQLISRYFPGDYLITPNGVHSSRFCDAAPLDLGTGRKILFLSRIEERKGLDILIKAVASLGDLGVTLVVAGDGPERKSCRAMARRMGVSVRFLGRVDEEVKPRLYRSCEIYCAPALSGESFGIVLLEAMAAGAPVVCSSLDGFRSVAKGAAVFVPPGDHRALARALRAVLTSEREIERMRAASLRKAAMFDWDRLAAGVEAVYEKAARTARIGA
ncbi:MAG TPA: glycosyltransferase family 4 protein [Actinomycetota bacterium]|jgi:phosphatidylinositol alpha-mannosyltransferase|nr:glycosyltransferase family 4 protein [Actinomycetota bacterium]